MRRPISIVLVLFTACLAACDSPSTAPDDDAGSRADTGTPDPDAGHVVDVDAGGGDEDAGQPPGTDAGTPSEVTIRFAGCEAFVACGGDPSGTWTYEDICIEDPFPAVRDACAGATVEDPSGTASGRVTLAAGAVVREAHVTLSGTIVIPASCAVVGCSNIQAALSSTYESASCTGGPTGCRCTVSDEIDILESDTYTVDGSTLHAGGRSYEFCVDGGALRYRELDDPPLEPGVYTLR